MPHTALPTFQDRLKTLWDTAISTAQVSVGWPTGGWTDKAYVFIPGEGRMETDTEQDSTFSTRDENLSTEVRIYVEKSSNSYTAVRDIAFGLLDAMEDALAADRTLAGLVQSAYLTGYEFKEGVEGTDRMMGIIARYSARATVT